jgi:hypothetical protein
VAPLFRVWSIGPHVDGEETLEEFELCSSVSRIQAAEQPVAGQGVSGIAIDHHDLPAMTSLFTTARSLTRKTTTRPLFARDPP